MLASDISQPILMPSEREETMSKMLEKQFGKVFAAFSTIDKVAGQQNANILSFGRMSQDFQKNELSLSRNRNALLSTMDKDLNFQTNAVMGGISEIQDQIRDVTSRLDGINRSIESVIGTIKSSNAGITSSINNLGKAIGGQHIDITAKVDSKGPQKDFNIGFDGSLLESQTDALADLTDVVEDIGGMLHENFDKLISAVKGLTFTQEKTLQDGLKAIDNDFSNLASLTSALDEKINLQLPAELNTNLIDSDATAIVAPIDKINTNLTEANDKLDLIYEEVSRRLWDISNSSRGSASGTSSTAESIGQLSSSIGKNFGSKGTKIAAAGNIVSGILSGLRQMLPEVASVFSFAYIGNSMKQQLEMGNKLARYTGGIAKDAGQTVSELRDAALGDFGVKFSLDEKNQALNRALDAGISNYNQLVGATKDLALTAKLLPDITLDLTEGYAKDLLAGYDNGAETIQGVAMVMKEYSDNMYVSANTLQRAVTKYGTTVYGLSDSMTTYMRQMDKYIKTMANLDENGLNNLGIMETVDYFANTARSQWSGDKLSALSVLGINAGEFESTAWSDPDKASQMLVEGFKRRFDHLDLNDTYNPDVTLAKEYANMLGVDIREIAAAMNGTYGESKVDRFLNGMQNDRGASLLGANDEETSALVEDITAQTAEEQIAQTWDEKLKNKLDDFISGKGWFGTALNKLNSWGIGGSIVTGVGSIGGSILTRKLGGKLLEKIFGKTAEGAAEGASGGGMLAKLKGLFSKGAGATDDVLKESSGFFGKIGKLFGKGASSADDAMRLTEGAGQVLGNGGKAAGTAAKGVSKAATILTFVTMALEAGSAANKAEEWTGRDSEGTRIATGLAGALAGTGGGIGSGEGFASEALDIGGGALKGAAIGAFGGPVGAAIGAVVGAGLSAIGGKRIGKFFGGIAKGAEDLNAGIDEWLEDHLGTVGVALSDVKNGVIDSVKKPLSGLMTGLGDVVTGFGKAGQKLMDGHPLEAFGEVLKGLVTGIWDIIKGLFKGLIAPFKGLWDGFKHLLGFNEEEESAAESALDAIEGSDAIIPEAVSATSDEYDNLQHSASDWSQYNNARGSGDLTGLNPYAFADPDLSYMPGDMTPVSGITQQINPMYNPSYSTSQMPYASGSGTYMGGEMTIPEGEVPLASSAEEASLEDTIYAGVSRVFEDFKAWYESFLSPSTGELAVSETEELPQDLAELEENPEKKQTSILTSMQKGGAIGAIAGVLTGNPLLGLAGIQAGGILGFLKKKKEELPEGETLLSSLYGSLSPTTQDTLKGALDGSKFGLLGAVGGGVSSYFRSKASESSDGLFGLRDLAENSGFNSVLDKVSESPLKYSPIGLGAKLLGNFLRPREELEEGISEGAPVSKGSILPMEDTSSDMETPLVSIVDAIANLETSVVSRLDRLIQNTEKPISIPSTGSDFIQNTGSSDIRNYA